MKYVLKLYVIGDTSNSLRAIKNLKKITSGLLSEQCIVEIIDVVKYPQSAIDENIIAVPTLIKSFPPPYRRVIGDLSNTENVIINLGLKPLMADRNKKKLENKNE